MMRQLKRLALYLWTKGEHEPRTNGHFRQDMPTGSGIPMPYKDRHLDDIDRDYLQHGGEQ